MKSKVGKARKRVRKGLRGLKGGLDPQKLRTMALSRAKRFENIVKPLQYRPSVMLG